jgi:hypothetical protein
MPEIGTSSSMSGDGKRSDGLRPQATAPILDSTKAAVPECLLSRRCWGLSRRKRRRVSLLLPVHALVIGGARANGLPATIWSRADQPAKLDAALPVGCGTAPLAGITAESLLRPANGSLGLKPGGPFVFKQLIT